ncbi:MAG: hypothetical protein ASARMPRED_008860 [Alectoria sarmentosa]|nr:MAG: hypothetical protein ASARMPRED_008860 [Alectoria sarmentosa]
MLLIILTLALLLPLVRGLLTPKQTPSIQRSVVSLLTAYKNVTASQAQDALQFQGTLPTAFLTGPTSLNASASPVGPTASLYATGSPVGGTGSLLGGTGSPVVTGSPVGGTASPVGPGAPVMAVSVGALIPTSTQSSLIAAASPLPNEAPASTTLGSTITVGSGSSATVLEFQTSSGETAFIHGSNTSIPDAEFTKLPGLVIGSQIITADDKNHYVIPSGHVLAVSSTVTLGSGTSTTILASGIQTLLVPGSSASLLSHASATPAISQILLPLTIGGQTMTANNLGQYDIHGQTLTSGGMITVSGTRISLAPDASDVVVGTSTKALTANITAAFSSGPKMTGGQTFQGSTLGARDGLWSSSVVFLIGIAVLLWL